MSRLEGVVRDPDVIDFSGRPFSDIPQRVGVNAIDLHVPSGTIFILSQHRG